MSSTPLLDGLKKEKKRKTILVGRIIEWLKTDGYKLDKFSKADWDFLQQLILVGTTRNRNVFSPSGATNCARRQVIDKHSNLVSLDYIDPHLQLVFDDGRWRHLRLQMMLWKMGIVKSAEEFRTLGELEYGGSTDVVVELVVRGQKTLVIVDFKGSHASQWNQIATTGKALPKHVLQVAIYCYLHPDVTQGLILYDNKNTQDLFEILVKPSPKLIARAVKRQKYMKRYVEHKAFPQEECNVGDSSDRRYTGCPQRLNCVRLPVHLIRKGQVLEVAKPRKSSEESTFVSLNQLHVISLNDPQVDRKRVLKKSTG